VSVATEEALRSAAFFDDPYGVYERLRRERPVYWSPSWRGWLVTRYDDVRSILDRPREFSSADRVRARMGGLPPEIWAAMEQIYGGFRGFFWSDPPEYTAHRTRANAALRPRIADIAPRVLALVDEAIDSFSAAGSADIIAALAYPLPATVIFEILGIPPQERDRFRTWSTDMIKLAKLATAENATTAMAGMDAACAWMRELLEQRRSRPQGDLLSVLAADTGLTDMADADFRVTVVTLIQFLLAGHETTTGLIGNGLLSLLERGESMHALTRDAAILRPAIEEMLRFDSPLQYLTRRATSAVELGGQSIEAGELVLPVLGSANRDGSQFPQPDRFDPARRPNRHVAFGHNIHFCLGAPLARLEAQIVFQRLLSRLPGLRRSGEIAWRQNPMFRALDTLPVAFDDVLAPAS